MPTLPIELHTRDFPLVFDEFERIVGSSTWKQAIAYNKIQIKRNHLLAEHIEEESRLAIALTRCSDIKAKFGTFPLSMTGSPWPYEPMGFAARSLFVIRQATGSARKNLLGRVKEAIRDGERMRAFSLELAVATHFVRRGYAVTWPESEGTGKFDLLIQNLGPLGLEIECKSASPDKGRRIHRKEAIEFYIHAYPQLKSMPRTYTKVWQLYSPYQHAYRRPFGRGVN